MLTADVCSPVKQENKREAAALLKAADLDVSTAIRLFLRSVVETGGLPIVLLRPNPATLAAIKASKAGKVTAPVWMTFEPDACLGHSRKPASSSADRTQIEGSGLDAFPKPLSHAYPSQVAEKVLGGHAAQLPFGPGHEPLVAIADRLDVVALTHLSVIRHRR